MSRYAELAQTTEDMDEQDEKKPVYLGEIGCQAKYGSGQNKGKSCHKKAYYKAGKSYYCGVHSPGHRTKLPKNPDKDRLKQEKGKEHEASVEAAQKRNKERKEPGQVKCAKMRMMAAAPYTPGYLNVYANFKHQNRKDGFGCASLSPMSVGPVNHGQKGLPPSKCLENYHQFNKVYAHETRKGEPSEEFRKLRLQGYKSSTPMRHKYNATATKRKAGQDVSRTVAYSLHSDSNGEEKHYTWVESRYFYCHFYEELVQGNKDLKTLREKIKDGVNIQITGFDGCDVTGPLNEYYESTRRSFGHELALYCLLTISDPKQYPWNEYYLKHKDIYPKELAPDCYRIIEIEESESEEESDSK